MAEATGKLDLHHHGYCRPGALGGDLEVALLGPPVCPISVGLLDIRNPWEAAQYYQALELRSYLTANSV